MSTEVLTVNTYRIDKLILVCFPVFSGANLSGIKRIFSFLLLLMSVNWVLEGMK